MVEFVIWKVALVWENKMSDFGTEILKRLLKDIEIMSDEELKEIYENAYKKSIQLEKDLELFNREDFPDINTDKNGIERDIGDWQGRQ
jgi:hypothetical protein